MSWKDRSTLVSEQPIGKQSDWKSRSTLIPEEKKRSAFERFGGALPIAGSTIGGFLATPTRVFGPAGAMGAAALGGAAGEAGRQILGRVLGEPSPQTSKEAAKLMGKEAAMGAAGELAGGLIGKVAGKAFKAFPKIASGISGTPAQNIARAQQRGFKVFFPGMGRSAAGEIQAKAEQSIISKLFTPEEQVLIKARDAGYADKLLKSAMLKRITGQPISSKEAIGLRIMAPVKRAADTARGLPKNIEIDDTVRGARAVIAEKYPELSRRLAQTEKSITASQLRKPFRVNKTNPDQISGLTATLGPMLGLSALAGSIPFSPLSMGLVGATMGQIKKSVPKLARRTIQRGAIQSLERALQE